MQFRIGVVIILCNLTFFPENMTMKVLWNPVTFVKHLVQVTSSCKEKWLPLISEIWPLYTYSIGLISHSDIEILTEQSIYWAGKTSPLLKALEGKGPYAVETESLGGNLILGMDEAFMEDCSVLLHTQRKRWQQRQCFSYGVGPQVKTFIEINGLGKGVIWPSDPMWSAFAVQ